jgi:hypothetical protein
MAEQAIAEAKTKMKQLATSQPDLFSLPAFFAVPIACC